MIHVEAISPEEAVMAGLARQRQMHTELNGYIKEGEKMQTIISLLRQLNDELKDHPKGDVLKKILTNLKKEGIDLQTEEDLKEEKISELKSWGSTKIDKLNTKLQTLFRTKIQPLNRALGEIRDSINKNYLEFLRSPAVLPS